MSPPCTWIRECILSSYDIATTLSNHPCTIDPTAMLAWGHKSKCTHKKLNVPVEHQLSKSKNKETSLSNVASAPKQKNPTTPHESTLKLSSLLPITTEAPHDLTPLDHSMPIVSPGLTNSIGDFQRTRTLQELYEFYSLLFLQFHCSFSHRFSLSLSLSLSLIHTHTHID